MYYSCHPDLYRKLVKARISDVSEVGLQRLDLLKLSILIYESIIIQKKRL